MHGCLEEARVTGNKEVVGVGGPGIPRDIGKWGLRRGRVQVCVWLWGRRWRRGWGGDKGRGGEKEVRVLD